MVRKTKRHNNNNKNKTLKGGRIYKHIDDICTSKQGWKKSRIIGQIKSKLRWLIDNKQAEKENWQKIYNFYFDKENGCENLKEMFKRWNSNQVHKNTKSKLYNTLKLNFFVFGKSKIPAYAIEYYPEKYIFNLSTQNALPQIGTKTNADNDQSDNTDEVNPKKSIKFQDDRNEVREFIKDEAQFVDLNKYELEFSKKYKKFFIGCIEQCMIDGNPSQIYCKIACNREFSEILNRGKTKFAIELRRLYKDFLQKKIETDQDAKQYFDEFVEDEYNKQLALEQHNPGTKPSKDDSEYALDAMKNGDISSLIYGETPIHGGKKRRYSSKRHRK